MLTTTAYRQIKVHHNHEKLYMYSKVAAEWIFFCVFIICLFLVLQCTIFVSNDCISCRICQSNENAHALLNRHDMDSMKHLSCFIRISNNNNNDNINHNYDNFNNNDDNNNNNCGIHTMMIFFHISCVHFKYHNS